MSDSITISHAQEVVSHLSQLTENKYSSIVTAANNTEKENLKKTAIGPRMADLQPDEVNLVGADDNQITKQELIDTFNSYLTKNGGLALTEKQKKYLWEKSIVVIKDPGGSDTAIIPSSPTVTNPSGTNKTSQPAEDTEAPTLSSSSPSNAATNIAKNSNEVAPLGSNSLNKPVTKLNLDADAEQSNDEKNLEKLVNLRYGLDLLESKEDVHVALGGNEKSYVDGALESLRNSTAPDSQIDGRYDEYKDGETPTSPGAFILKQAIEEYKQINRPLAEKAEAARDKNISSEMSPDEKKALIAVFENYQKKFTKLEGEVSEEKLKKYLTHNYDTLKDLGIDDFPADTAAINGKKKEELITLAVAARNKLNEKISEEFKNITISPDDKKAFLKKYTDIDFSDSGKSIELIKGLTDKELLLFNRWGSNNFHSRDFIISLNSDLKLNF